VLSELSRESRAWMATWHFNGGYTVLYAADGKIRARMGDFVFPENRVEDGDPAALDGLRAMLDALGPEDFDGKRAAAFAFIEAATGMGLDMDLPEAENVPVVVLD